MVIRKVNSTKDDKEERISDSRFRTIMFRSFVKVLTSLYKKKTYTFVKYKDSTFQLFNADYMYFNIINIHAFTFKSFSVKSFLYFTHDNVSLLNEIERSGHNSRQVFFNRFRHVK